MEGDKINCEKVNELIPILIDQEYYVEHQLGKYFCGYAEFSNKREGVYNNFAIILSGTFSYRIGTDEPINVDLVNNRETGELKLYTGSYGSGHILDTENANNYIPLSMYQGGACERTR